MNIWIVLMIVCFSIPLKAQTDGQFQLSTHVLDIQEGKPAPAITIRLFKQNAEEAFIQIDEGVTDQNGRIADFLPFAEDNSGIYKLRFETLPYFERKNVPSIYPFIEIVFRLEGKGHYHIPITVSANGYATYKGN